MEGKFTQNGIYYETENFKKWRQTLIFIHGLSGSLSAWDSFKDLSDHYNLVFLTCAGTANQSAIRAMMIIHWKILPKI